MCFRQYLIWVCSILLLVGCTSTHEEESSITFKGRVVDSSEQTPLPGVSVRITNGELTKQSTYTSENGVFELNVKVSEVDQTYFLLLSESKYSHSKQLSLKGFGAGYFDYGDIPFYDASNPNDLQTFTYGGNKYYIHPPFETDSWNDALNKCISLDSKGYSDWILPTYDELSAAQKAGLLEDGNIYWTTTFGSSENIENNSHYLVAQCISTSEGSKDVVTLRLDQPYSIVRALPIRCDSRNSRTYITYSIQSRDISNIVVNGYVISESNQSIGERGVCWALNNMPTIADNKISDGEGVGEFNIRIENLPDDVNVYVRPYVIESGSTIYGTVLSLKIPNQKPTITDFRVSSTRVFSATFGYSITSAEGSELIDHGLCWSTEPHPTLDDNVTVAGTSAGTYLWGSISGLSPNTTYYVVAYARNRYTTVYSDVITINTQPGECNPGIMRPTNVSATSATVSGSVKYLSDQNDIEVTERGVCYKVLTVPYIEDNHVVCGSGIGEFTAYLTELEPGKVYDVRAYAITNAGQVCYSPEVFFSTKSGAPSISTHQRTDDFSSTQILAQGEVLSDGGYSVKDRGFVWGYGSKPDISRDNKVSCGSGVGSFSAYLTGFDLSKASIYWRSYAINENGTVYGDDQYYVPEDLEYLDFPIIEFNGNKYRVAPTAGLASSGSTAVSTASNYTVGSIGGFFLPSIDILREVYCNKNYVGGWRTYNGLEYPYWSSTNTGYGAYYVLWISDGKEELYDDFAHIRAVRLVR